MIKKINITWGNWEKVKSILDFILIFVLPMVIGLVLLIFGIMGIYKDSVAYKDYISTTATYIKTSNSNLGINQGTSFLVYSYKVDGIDYTISTEFETEVIPKEGTTKTIKYDPNNPSKAVFNAFDSNSTFLLAGFMFTFIPLVLLLPLILSLKLDNSDKGLSKKRKIEKIFLGTGILIMGSLGYYTFSSSGDSLSIKSVFEVASFWVLIPILFMFVGSYLLIMGVFGKNIQK